MKYHISAWLLLFIAVSFSGHTQNSNRGEFATELNGLMYSDTSMKYLRHMVDSLNLRFKTCDLSRKFYSEPQGKVWQIRFASENDDMKGLRKDLDHNVDIQTLTKKYQSMIQKIDSSQLLIAINSGEQENEIRYLIGRPGMGYNVDYDLEGKEIVPKRWNYKFSGKDKYSKSNELVAYKITERLQQQAIPDEYAKYLQYVDCMIDTSTEIFLTSKHERYSKNTVPEIDAVKKFINRKMKITKKKDFDYYEYLTADMLQYAKEHLEKDKEFIELVEEMADACIENNTGNNTLEELVEVIISKQKALEMKRHRIVVGNCSMDRSPREHAKNIAILAAESNSWDIFLRAHMDIMNDRFERLSDGSYAYGLRKTYLKELELLDLDMTDLIFGMSLHAHNLPEKHYYGTIWRLGWAMTESKDKDAFEKVAITMMKDTRLDPFNRGLIFILFSSYLRRLDDIKLANEKIHEWKKNINDFPQDLRIGIGELEDRKAGEEN